VPAITAYGDGIPFLTTPGVTPVTLFTSLLKQFAAILTTSASLASIHTGAAFLPFTSGNAPVLLLLVMVMGLLLCAIPAIEQKHKKDRATYFFMVKDMGIYRYFSIFFVLILASWLLLLLQQGGNSKKFFISFL
jgi:hypothetical protein